MDLKPFDLSLQLGTMPFTQVHRASQCDLEPVGEQEESLESGTQPGTPAPLKKPQALGGDCILVDTNIDDLHQQLEKNCKKLATTLTSYDGYSFEKTEGVKVETVSFFDVNEAVRIAMETTDNLSLCDFCVDDTSPRAISTLRSHAIAVNYQLLSGCRRTLKTLGEWKIYVEQGKNYRSNCPMCGKRLDKSRKISVDILHKEDAAQDIKKEPPTPHHPEFGSSYNTTNSRNENISTTVVTNTKETTKASNTIISATTVVSTMTATATIATLTSLTSYKWHDPEEQVGGSDLDGNEAVGYKGLSNTRSWAAKKRNFHEIEVDKR